MRCTVFALRTQRDTARAERDAALAVIGQVRAALAMWQSNRCDLDSFVRGIRDALVTAVPTEPPVLPDGERITDDNGDELEHGTESVPTEEPTP